jgi:hypothetical protein
VDLEPTTRETLDHRLSNLSGLGLSPAVDHDIVRVPLERHVWVGLFHPGVEREMQENIREHWTDDAALRRPGLPLLKGAIP